MKRYKIITLIVYVLAIVNNAFLAYGYASPSIKNMLISILLLCMVGYMVYRNVKTYSSNKSIAILSIIGGVNGVLTYLYSLYRYSSSSYFAYVYEKIILLSFLFFVAPFYGLRFIFDFTMWGEFSFSTSLIYLFALLLIIIFNQLRKKELI